MITFDFDYYRPTALDEAVNLFQHLQDEGKKPIYYSGGTEIISFARSDKISFGAVIDLKEIPECTLLEVQGEKLVLGSSLTLTKLVESNHFPLLTDVCKTVAEHTAQDMITLGGNICGKIPYREAVLPFLVAESEAVIAGPRGLRNEPLNDIFHERLQLGTGDFLLQLKTEQCFTSLPHESKKRTKRGRVDYPLVAIAGIKQGDRIKIALSGVCAFPFRSEAIEDAINDRNNPVEQRIDKAIGHLPGPLSSDIQGSWQYRKFVLRNMLADTLAKLEGVRKCL